MLVFTDENFDVLPLVCQCQQLGYKVQLLIQMSVYIFDQEQIS